MLNFFSCFKFIVRLPKVTRRSLFGILCFLSSFAAYYTIMDIFRNETNEMYKTDVNGAVENGNKKAINFIIQSNPHGAWDFVTLCAVYSAARHNSGFEILVHTIDNVLFPPQWLHLPNIRILYRNRSGLERLFLKTPLADWYNYHLDSRIDFPLLFDAMKFAIVVRQPMHQLCMQQHLYLVLDRLWFDS